MQTALTRQTELDAEPRLLAIRTLCGVEVHDLEGGYVGDIEALMLDPATGWVTHAIVSCGDWLGSGERFHPLPWSVLEYVPEDGAYVIAIERTTLEVAPAFSRAEMADPALPWRDYVHHHYGSPPYWS